MDRGRRSPDTVVNGTPHPHSEWTACGGPASAFWQPKNDSPGQRGPYSVRSATAQSVNAAYQSMAEQLDLCDIRDVAERLGVHLATGGELPWNPGSLLGTESIAPLTMASAYAGIANGGRFMPVVIDQVVAPDGEELGGQPRTCTQAVSPQTAATAFDVMQGAFRGGTASGGQTPTARPCSARPAPRTLPTRCGWWAGPRVPSPPTGRATRTARLQSFSTVRAAPPPRPRGGGGGGGGGPPPPPRGGGGGGLGAPPPPPGGGGGGPAPPPPPGRPGRGS
ncbi:penicillin-binding transpeptidase domain-containing protein [Curtobacterium flaccumfaciens pv. flaccumfaciens]|uniref:penicillin-binding transpeptidase domain-containing protein n=1 Tax=Curtobacterium flaccumfaciens TaxID=2035 RepID=UPI002657EE5B|nr:penicillin-binding transpeptidase domain-containing protein [Curtobacterium flaccumfaciens]MCS5508470.1 penicillin-binding transpeptidase domain-containing protein [Curtobacterium flaccumfaciens pv. flaccumfaciens]